MALLGALPRPLRAVSTTDLGALYGALRSALDGSGPAIMPVAEERDRDVPRQVPPRIAVVMETSGSTGTPKRVMLSAKALQASAAATAQVLGTESDSQWLLALPPHHIAGLQVLVRSLVAGTTPAALPSGSFDTHVFSQTVSSMTSTKRCVSLVPAQLLVLLDQAHNPAVLAAARSFHAILVGGQALDDELRTRALERGLALRTTYGSTETCGGCVYDGVPIGDTRVQLVDSRIEIAGSVLADGYLAEPERTADAFTTDDETRWYRSNDRGEIVAGKVVVRSRIDNVIVSGGVKISLDELERVVRGVDGWGDALVVAGRHARWGQTPVVVTTTKTHDDLPALRTLVAEHLGRQSAPTRLLRVDTLPYGPAGKPDRDALRALADAADHS